VAEGSRGTSKSVLDEASQHARDDSRIPQCARKPRLAPLHVAGAAMPALLEPHVLARTISRTLNMVASRLSMAFSSRGLYFQREFVVRSVRRAMRQ